MFRNNVLAGILTELGPREYVFRYEEEYLKDSSLPPISLTLPKNQREHRSGHLFPFFFNMLAEGVNRNLQSRQLRIDENDFFGLLIATAQYDTIGAITLKPIQENPR